MLRRQLFKKLEERNSSINNAKQRWDFVKMKINPSDGEGETTEENNNSRPDASGSEQVQRQRSGSVKKRDKNPSGSKQVYL